MEGSAPRHDAVQMIPSLGDPWVSSWSQRPPPLLLWESRVQMGKPPASEQACREPCGQDLSALVTRWTNGVCDNTEHRRLAWSGVRSNFFLF